MPMIEELDHIGSDELEMLAWSQYSPEIFLGPVL
jgi:hypothetical protein